MNTEEVENMTVAALKKELKSRNLPTIGNKVDLVQRLIEHYATEEQKLLHDNSESDDLLDLPDELVLGLDATINGSISKNNENLLATPVEKLPVPETSSLKLRQVSSSADNKLGPLTTPKATQKDPIVESTPQTEKKPVEAPMTENEKKELRAKKFHVPVVQTKEMRAKRFGIEPTTKSSPKPIDNQPLSASKSDKVSVTEKLKSRAERFGLSSETPTSVSEEKNSTSNGEKLKQRSLRFAVKASTTNAKVSLSSIKITTASETEKRSSDVLLKRKHRFGDMISNKGDVNGPEAKKILRAQRFGASLS